MKTTNGRQTLWAALLFIMLFVTYNTVKAQNFQLEAKLKVENHKSVKQFLKSLFKPTECTVEILNLTTGAVTIKPAVKVLYADLEYNQEYTIVISRDGYQPKSIYINTNCNLNQSFYYRCAIQLKENQIADDIPYQAGAIFYNDNKEEFDYWLTKN